MWDHLNVEDNFREISFEKSILSIGVILLGTLFPAACCNLLKGETYIVRIFVRKFGLVLEKFGSINNHKSNPVPIASENLSLLLLLILLYIGFCETFYSYFLYPVVFLEFLEG